MGEQTTRINNLVTISGQIVSEFKFSYQAFGIRFYESLLKSNRLNEQSDIIPIIISEKKLSNARTIQSSYVQITGSFRSYNEYQDEKNKLLLSVFVKNITEKNGNENDINSIFLRGFTCKDIIYRITPSEIEIADVMLAVNRPNGQSDYIPSIIWKDNAREIKNIPVGTEMKIWGRIQSREYLKKISDEEVEKRVAYEVSIGKFKLV